MIPKPLTAITLADLQSLQDNAVAEGKTLEYKRELPGEAPEDRKKVLRAICSFANTAGGDLIYGIEAQDGIPVSLPGIDNPNEDALRLRLENACRDGVDPRLPHMEFKFIPVAEGRSALVVRVSKSWNSPHRLKQDGHFYGRNSAGCYQLDVGELRQSFTLSETVAERIRAFRAGRLTLIGGNETPVKMTEGAAKLVFHIVPLAAFMGQQWIDIDQAQEPLRHLAPLGASGYSWKLNLDGHVNYTGDGRAASRAYVQVFRSGIVEAVEEFSVREGNDRPIWPASYEPQLLQAMVAYLNMLQQFEIEPPFYLFLSFVGVMGYRLALPNGTFIQATPIADRDMLALPEAVVSDFGADPIVALRPLFELTWNAFGITRPANFNQ